MKILINCSTLKKGGVLQVAHSFVMELLQRSDHDYYFIFSTGLIKDLPDYIKEDKVRYFIHDVKPSLYKLLTGRNKVLDHIFSKVNPDIVFSLFGPTYWNPRSKHICGYAKASYFYPDSPFIQKLPLFRRLKLLFLKQFHMNDFKKFNDVLITETNDASTRLMGLLPSKRVFTVSNTYNQIFEQPDKWDHSHKLNSFDGITLLSITANYRHKNLSIIPDVIKYLNVKYPDFKYRFVLTLKENELNLSDESIRKHIISLGKVTIYQCPPLYQNADFMFMPTLLECFSATYPEAMKMNVPILTSDMPFAKDVCADAAIYFNPLSPESIGEAIYSLANNPQLVTEQKQRGQERLKTFNSSQSRAQQYIDILEQTYFPQKKNVKAHHSLVNLD